MIRYSKLDEVSDSHIEELLTWTDKSLDDVEFVLETNCWSIHFSSWKSAPLIIFSDGSLILGIWFAPIGITNPDGTYLKYPDGHREPGLEWKWAPGNPLHNLIEMNSQQVRLALERQTHEEVGPRDDVTYFTFEAYGNDYASDGYSSWVTGASIRKAPIFGGNLPPPVLNCLRNVARRDYSDDVSSK